MSSLSPASVLFSSDGYEVAVINGTAIPTGTRGYLFEGSDGTDSRFITVDTSGRQVVVGAGTAGSPIGGVVTIQGISGGTAVPISGTVTAINPSVGTDGATALTFDTQVGAIVSTSAPTYTTGNLNALSLTALGGLRVDGVYAAGTVTGTAIDASVSGAYVTTAAPTYTTGQLNVMSLTTSGLLRIDGVYPVNATTPTTDIAFVGGAVTISAPTYTNGQLSALSLDTSGNLRTTAVIDRSSTTNLTSVSLLTSSVTLLASNTSRISATFVNDSVATTMYIALSATATTTAYTIKVLAGDYWELPVSYTGAVSAICNIAQGSCRITELTP